MQKFHLTSLFSAMLISIIIKIRIKLINIGNVKDAGMTLVTTGIIFIPRVTFIAWSDDREENGKKRMPSILHHCEGWVLSLTQNKLRRTIHHPLMWYWNMRTRARESESERESENEVQTKDKEKQGKKRAKEIGDKSKNSLMGGVRERKRKRVSCGTFGFYWI